MTIRRREQRVVLVLFVSVVCWALYAFNTTVMNLGIGCKQELELPVPKRQMSKGGLSTFTNLAIVMPFVPCQLDKVDQNLISWLIRVPCSINQSTAFDHLGKATFFFYQGQTITDNTYYRLVRIWEKISTVHHCFQGGMHAISANLSAEEDIYPTGTCLQFYAIFPKLRDMGFDHWFLMEPDVRPIRSEWAHYILALSTINVKCRLWWQLGSTSMYTSNIDFHQEIGNAIDLHLNGNSLYCLLSDQFDDYRRRVILHFSPYGCADDLHGYLLGFDHAMYRFRVKEHNKEYARSLHSKFAASNFILNFGQTNYDIQSILLHFPDTYFVHGKALPAKKSQTIWQEEAATLIYRHFGRFATPSDIVLLESQQDNIGSYSNSELASFLQMIADTAHSIALSVYGSSLGELPLKSARILGSRLISVNESIQLMSLQLLLGTDNVLYTLPKRGAAVFSLNGNRNATEIVLSDLCTESSLQFTSNSGLLCRLFVFNKTMAQFPFQDWHYDASTDSIKLTHGTLQGNEHVSLSEVTYCTSKISFNGGVLQCKRNEDRTWPIQLQVNSEYSTSPCKMAHGKAIQYLDRQSPQCVDGLLNGFHFVRCGDEDFAYMLRCKKLSRTSGLEGHVNFTRCVQARFKHLEMLLDLELTCRVGFLQKFTFTDVGCGNRGLRYKLRCVFHWSLSTSKCTERKTLAKPMPLKQAGLEHLEKFPVFCENDEVLKGFALRWGISKEWFYHFVCCKVVVPQLGENGWTVERMGGSRFDPLTESFFGRFRSIFQATSLASETFTQDSLIKEEGKLHSRLWSTDLHAAPSMCNRVVYEDLGIYLDARVDFGNCKFFHDSFGRSVCANRRGLKAFGFDDWRGFGLDPCPNLVREKFYQAYRVTQEFSSVDFIMCSHPAANCELYLPFPVPLIVYVTTRLEFGRWDKHVDWRKAYITYQSSQRWKEWVIHLRAISSKEENIVLANNEYDAAYIEYFSGVKAKTVPSWCGERPSTNFTYRPTKLEVLIGPYRTNLNFYPNVIPSDGWPNKTDSRNAFKHPILSSLRKALTRHNNRFSFISLLAAFHGPYGHPRELASYPAMLFIPYQCSTMSFFEYYRQNIPLLVPSRSLLLSWIQKYGIMWERVYGNPSRFSHLSSTLPNPNSRKLHDVVVWMDKYDIYQTKTFPHLLYFNSWDHALEILEYTDLEHVANAMSIHNLKAYQQIKKEWLQIFQSLRRARESSLFNSTLSIGLPESLSDAMRKRYGLTYVAFDFSKQCNSSWAVWNMSSHNNHKNRESIVHLHCG